MKGERLMDSIKREIKFRAWDKRFNQMEENPLCSCYDPRVNDEFYYSESGQSNLIFMQYTGLKDKNGKEIYEGDFFDAKLGNLFKVYYNNQHARFSVELIRTSGKMIGISKPNFTDLQKMEIVGNIYENPELL